MLFIDMDMIYIQAYYVTQTSSSTLFSFRSSGASSGVMDDVCHSVAFTASAERLDIILNH